MGGGIAVPVEPCRLPKGLGELGGQLVRDSHPEL